MPFARPTLTTIISRLKSDLQASITGATTLLRRAVLSVIAKVFGAALHSEYGYLDYLSKQIFIATASEEELAEIAKEYGIDRKAASKAIGSADGTGTNGTIIPINTEFQSPDGIVYLNDADVTIAAGVFTVDLTAQVAGADGNDDPSITLNFVSPISGADTTVIVDADGLEGGSDIEDVEDWRQRLLSRKRNPPHGGAEVDYDNWTLEVPGNTRVWTFPLYNGLGTVGVAYVRDDDTPITPSLTERQTTRAYLVSHEDPATGDQIGIPVTAEPGLEIIDLSELVIDFTIKIDPSTATIQAAIQTSVNNAIEEYGGPGETLFLSRFQTAIGETVNLERFEIVVPAADVTATQTQVHVPGTYTFAGF
jgi:uncharacterized phage protein gp47/JayE